MCLFLFTTLSIYETHNSIDFLELKITHNQTNLEIDIYGVFFQPAHISATNIERLLPEAVLKQSVSPDDEHCVLETCREL